MANVECGMANWESGRKYRIPTLLFASSGLNILGGKEGMANTGCGWGMRNLTIISDSMSHQGVFQRISLWREERVMRMMRVVIFKIMIKLVYSNILIIRRLEESA